MDHVNDDDILHLAKRDTVATLVPGANYFLGLKEYPNARRLIDAGVPVALASDYNPGTSPTMSMPMAMSLACTHMKMSPAEAVGAATINGAWALRVADRKGSIEPGKDADFAVFDSKGLSRDPVLVRRQSLCNDDSEWSDRVPRLNFRESRSVSNRGEVFVWVWTLRETQY